MGDTENADFNLIYDDPYSWDCTGMLVARLHRAVDRRERRVRAAICWVVQLDADGHYRHEFDARDATGRRIEPDPREFDLALRVCGEWRDHLVSAGLQPWRGLVLLENDDLYDGVSFMSLEGVPEIGTTPHEQLVDWAWSLSTNVDRESD